MPPTDGRHDSEALGGSRRGNPPPWLLCDPRASGRPPQLTTCDELYGPHKRYGGIKAPFAVRSSTLQAWTGTLLSASMTMRNANLLQFNRIKREDCGQFEPTAEARLQRRKPRWPTSPAENCQCACYCGSTVTGRRKALK